MTELWLKGLDADDHENNDLHTTIVYSETGLDEDLLSE